MCASAFALLKVREFHDFFYQALEEAMVDGQIWEGKRLSHTAKFNM